MGIVHVCSTGEEYYYCDKTKNLHLLGFQQTIVKKKNDYENNRQGKHGQEKGLYI